MLLQIITALVVFSREPEYHQGQFIDTLACALDKKALTQARREIFPSSVSCFALLLCLEVFYFLPLLARVKN